MPKDIRYLSKRRKNQLINLEYNLHKNSNVLQLPKSSTAHNNSDLTVLTYKERNNMSCTDSTRNISSDDDEFNDSSLEIESNSFEECNIESENDICAMINVFDSKKSNLRQDLRTFIINSNIPHRVANELLHILKKNGHIELPNDVKCLLGTPRNVSSHIQSIANGRYIHFGLSSLERSI